jgi:hypothetical protein
MMLQTPMMPAAMVAIEISQLNVLIPMNTRMTLSNSYCML